MEIRKRVIIQSTIKKVMYPKGRFLESDQLTYQVANLLTLLHDTKEKKKRSDYSLQKSWYFFFIFFFKIRSINCGVFVQLICYINSDYYLYKF